MSTRPGGYYLVGELIQLPRASVVHRVPTRDDVCAICYGRRGLRPCECKCSGECGWRCDTCLRKEFAMQGAPLCAVRCSVCKGFAVPIETFRHRRPCGGPVVRRNEDGRVSCARCMMVIYEPFQSGLPNQRRTRP